MKSSRRSLTVDVLRFAVNAIHQSPNLTPGRHLVAGGAVRAVGFVRDEHARDAVDVQVGLVLTVRTPARFDGVHRVDVRLAGGEALPPTANTELSASANKPRRNMSYLRDLNGGACLLISSLPVSKKKSSLAGREPSRQMRGSRVLQPARYETTPKAFCK
jgi:hypothetical protein